MSVLKKIVKPRPVLRAVVELLNAANGVRPLARKGYLTIPVFCFGWPTSEMSPLLHDGLDARRDPARYSEGDFRGRRGAE